MYKRISFVLAVILVVNLFGMVATARAQHVSVPWVMGQTEDEARSRITSKGLVVGDVSYEYHRSQPIGTVITQDPAGGVIVPVGSAVDFVVSLGRLPVQVPDVVGMTEDEAKSALNYGVHFLHVQIAEHEYSCMVPEGHVISQDPSGGTMALEYDTVYLTISLGPPIVPDVVGMAQAAAESTINSTETCPGAGIEVGTISYEYSDTVPEGHVISQSPTAGTEFCGLVSVDLIVSIVYCTVPDVVGMTESDAESAINSANLSVGSIGYQYSDTVPAGCVIRQYPAAGTEVEPGTDVDLDISLGPDTGGPTVEVPDVVGMSESDAKSVINSASLNVGIISNDYSDTIPKGFVISQSPAGGTSVSEGSSVSLRISMGPKPDDGPPAPPDKSCLVAHWKLDDGFGNTAVDSSGNDLDITLHDTTWENGVFGGAVHFHGVGYGEVSDLNCNDNAITVCAWVFHDEFRVYRIERYVTVTGPSVAVIRKEYDGRLHFYIGANGNFRHLWVDDVLTEGQWHHVAGTWDGLTQCLYIDGVEIDSQKPGSVLGNTSSVMLSSGDEPFNGMLDDVRIYKCGLSADNILQLFYAEPTEECLVAHWKLDETAGVIAYDSIGGNDGILYGNPIWRPKGGMLGGALEFDGDDDYVGCGTFNPSKTTGQLSICLWAKWNGLNGEYQGLIGKRDSLNANNMMWQLEASHVSGDVVFKREGVEGIAGGILTEGDWEHWCVTFDGATAVIYRNGKEINRGAFSFGSKTDARMVFGAVAANATNSFNGALDDVRIYDCPLDENQIKSLIGVTPSPPAPPSDPLSEALDTDLSFTTGGSADWFRQTSTSFYGGDAAQSGDISDGQSSWIQTTVSGEGTVSFYWKVSSERYFDLLRFYIDGSPQERIGGSVDWQWKTYMVSTSGSHLLEWRYEKDGSGSSGSDCGWVDKMEWIPTP